MSDHLIHLVKSLTRSEKRYVNLNLKTFSSDEESNLLLSDFNAIEHFTGLKRNKREPSVKSNRTRLYYRILDILFELYKEQLYDNENDNRLIKRSQILFHKGFYQEGIKYLEKVIHKGEAFSYLLKIEAIELRIRAAIKFVDVDYLKNDFEVQKQLLSDISRFYFNQLEFESIWAIVKLESTISYFYGARNELLEKYTQLLSDERHALSPGAKIYFHQINAFLKMKEGDLNTAETHMRSARDIFNSNPELRNNKFSDYLRALRNHCVTLIQKKGYEEVNQYLEEVTIEIDTIRKSRSPSFRNDIFTLTVLLRLDNIINNNKVKENAELLPGFEQLLKEWVDSISLDERSTAYFTLALSYLILGDNRKAIRLINPAIQFSKTVRKDLHHLSLMLEICVHYQAGNNELLETKLRSFSRFINKHGPLFDFEKKMPELMGDLIKDPHNRNHFRQLQSYLNSELERENKTAYKAFMPFFYLKAF